MLDSWLGQRPGEEEIVEGISSRTNPRPSFSSPTETMQARASTDKPLKRASTAIYTTPHDAVLSELQGITPKPCSHDDAANTPFDKDNYTISPDFEPVQPEREDNSTSPALQQLPSRFASSDILIDPFDGSSLGTLIPHAHGGLGDSQATSQINLLNTQEAGVNTNPAGSEAIWAHLSRVLDLQSDISKMHLQMESIGQARAGDWKGKRPRRSTHGSASENMANSATLNPEEPILPPGLRHRQRAMSTVSTISSTEPENDEERVNVADEEEERSRIRGEEFAKLASQFEGRKEAINQIMVKLDDLSKTLSEFHALQTPNIEFPSSRNNSGGAASPAANPSLPPQECDPNSGAPVLSRSSVPSGGRTYEWTQQNVTASSSLNAHSPLFVRTKSDTAVVGVPTVAIPQKKNVLVPTLLVNSMDPGKQTHVVDSPASTLGSLKLPPEE